MRRILVAVVSAALVAMLASPAKADIPAAYTQVGHISGTFHNPNNAAQFVNWAVAIDQGDNGGDSASELFSGVGRVNVGAGVLRFQIVNIRSGIGARVINDYFVSKNPLVRSNTPPGCRFVTPPTANLFDDKTPPDGCSGITDAVKNPLHNVADYEPDATLVRGFSDQLPTDIQNCPTEAVRVFFEVRFADNSVWAFNRRTPDVSSNGPGCP